MKITLSKSMWEKIGLAAKWIKEARVVVVDYSVGMSAETKRVKVRVDPDEIKPNERVKDVVQRKLDKREKAPTVIVNYVPVSTIRTKKGPSQKDLQRMRGDKMRQERERRLRREEFETEAPNSPEELIKQMEGQDTDLGLVDVLKNRQEVRSPETQRPPDKDILDLIRKRQQEKPTRPTTDLHDLIRKVKPEMAYASTEHVIKVSKSQWQQIGKVAGWSTGPDDDKFQDDLSFMTDEDWRIKYHPRSLENIFKSQAKTFMHPDDETMLEDFVRVAHHERHHPQDIVQGLTDFYRQSPEVAQNIYDRVMARIWQEEKKIK